jgi:uncharacterized alkaline shock family protein YloU
MQEYIRSNDGVGGLVISDEVIAAIAVNAAKDVDGVTGFATRTPDFVQSVFNIGRDSNKSVRVFSNDNDIKIHINIIISDTARIPDVASAVQHSVKCAVQNMTGRVVNKVNVTVAGMGFGDEKTDKK